MSGGKGGDGGASARAAEDRERKSSAIREINKIFGISSDAPSPYASLGDKFNKLDKFYGGQGRLKEFFARSDEARNKDNLQRRQFASDNRSKREAAYDENTKNVFEFNKSNIDRDNEEASRNLRFELARSGLFGGSVDADENQKKNLAYDRGILQARSLADQSTSNFRSADERARLDIINQIQSGVDSSSAIDSAQRSLDLAAQNANADARGNAIGNVFNDAGLLYQNRQQQSGVDRAREKYPLGAYFNSQKNSSGTVRR